MKINFLKPYNFLVVFAIIIFFISFFLTQDTVDFHLHDTMYVMSLPHIFWLLAILILFFALVYKLTNRFLLSKYLSWIHIILTLLSLLAILLYPIWAYRSHSTFIDGSFERFIAMNRLLSWFAGLFAFAQLLLLINIIAGLIKLQRTKQESLT